MLGSHVGAPLQSQWWLRAAHHIAASDFGTAVQAICPLLLLVGLLARPAALAMLVQVVLLPPAGMAHGLGNLWLALLIFIMVSGPGALSLDRLFARGVAASPIPFARAFAATYRFLPRRIGPVALVALRLLAAIGAVPALMEAARLLHFAGLPTMLPPPILWAVAILLAVGLCTRFAALVLLNAAPFMAASPDERLFWSLMLLVLVVRGGGSVGLDALLHRIAMRPRRTTSLRDLPHVVVLGAGFGGVAAARGLAAAPCRVTLIDRTNYTLFQPLRYQVATAGLSPAEIATPIRSLFRGRADVNVLLGEITVSHRAADLAGRIIPTRTVLWAAGVMASPAAQWLGVSADKAGRVQVEPDLSVTGWPDVFVIGDTAACLGWNGAAVPGLAPAAKQGGAYVARVIAARLRDAPPPPPSRYRHFGSLATIGRDAAVADSAACACGARWPGGCGAWPISPSWPMRAAGPPWWRTGFGPI